MTPKEETAGFWGPNEWRLTPAVDGSGSTYLKCRVDANTANISNYDYRFNIEPATHGPQQ